MPGKLSSTISPSSSERQVSLDRDLQDSSCQRCIKHALSSEYISPDSKRVQYLITPTTTDGTAGDVMEQQDLVLGPNSDSESVERQLRLAPPFSMRVVHTPHDRVILATLCCLVSPS